MSDSTEVKLDQQIEVSPAIQQAIEDGLHLISYIAKNGSTRLPEDLAKAMISAKFKSQSGVWSCQDETEFLLNYDELSTLVYPVTIDSINAVTVTENAKGKFSSPAEKAVNSYRRFAMVSLALMLIAHLYFIIGNNLKVNLTQIFDHREEVHQTLIQLGEDKAKTLNVKEELSLANQKLDANYELMKMWNSVATFGHEFTSILPNYTKERLTAEYNIIQQKIQLLKKNDAGITDEDIAKKLYILPEESGNILDLYGARIKYFKNLLAADFILGAFQNYLLPLLYGLLGACIYLLRSLHQDIQNLTYTRSSEIKYRLRLTLGALSGMVIGWFFKPQSIDAVASLSPMALSFLMGYNVDILFSLMDKIIDNIRNMIDRDTNPTPSNQVSNSPVANSQVAQNLPSTQLIGQQSNKN